MQIPSQRIVSLATGPLLLRPLQPADADAVYEAAYTSRREIGRWMTWCHETYQRDETVAFLGAHTHEWTSGLAFGFGIWERATSRFVGSVGLNNLNYTYNFANLGYWVRTDATGHGIASQATRCLAAWGLRELRLQRIEIVVALGNLSSRRVAEKAGAQREGVLRRRLQLRGAALDAVMYSLIADDFQ